MQQLNSIHIVGFVAQSHKVETTEGITYHFNVATNRVYRDHHGDPCIDTTWLNVVAVPAVVAEPEKLTTGQGVELEGFIRHHAYTDRDGVQRNDYVIVPRTIKYIDVDTTLCLAES